MNELADPIRKVERYLKEVGCAAPIRTTDDTIFTVEDASRAVGAPAREILKSLMLFADDRPVLALMSGVNRVDLKKVRKFLNARKVKMASPEWVFEYSGFRIGGVPPVGYPARLPALLDEDLFLFETVWAAAGTDHAIFPVSPEELVRITGGTATDIRKADGGTDGAPAGGDA